MKRCRHAAAIAWHEFVLLAEHQESIDQAATSRRFTGFRGVARMMLQQQQEGVESILKPPGQQVVVGLGLQ